MRPGSTLSPENRRVLSISNAVNFLTLADVQSTIDQTLTPDQRLQYAEISFQAGGGLDSRHLNDQFLGVLKLTGAQKDQIRKMTAEYAKEVAEVVSARRETLRQQYGEPKPLKAPPPFDWLNATQAEKDKYIAEIAADAYDHAMNDPVNVAYMKAQPSYREEDEARAKRHNERVKALLTLEQKKKAEKLTAEAPALVAKIMNRNKEPDASKLATKEQRGQQDQKEQKGQKEQTPAWIYVPNDGSWRPGEPLPNQIERKPGNFPRKKAEQ
jgi:Spy/CpxP family protein refolding chaperone